MSLIKDNVLFDSFTVSGAWELGKIPYTKR